MDALVSAAPSLPPFASELAPTTTQHDDPLRPVTELGRRASWVGWIIGALIALSTHGVVSVQAVSSLVEMQRQVQAMREALHEYFWATYDVEVRQEPEPEQPEPEPEPEPVVEPKPPETASVPEPEPEPESDDPYEDDPPPAPAEAAKILTADPDPDEPVDLTAEGFVTGEGTGPSYGYVSAKGTAKSPTFDRHAQVGGVEGGKGKGPPQRARPPRRNASRPAGIVGGRSWSCPFPPEADIEQIDRATAVLVVTVAPDGRPVSVRVLSDPGYGFGRQARQCALGRRYRPALDRDGRPIQATTPPINVRFRR